MEEANVDMAYLPNIDAESIPAVRHLVEAFPDRCRAMMGLHPCSVQEGDVAEQLNPIYRELRRGGYWAVGEIGLDAYWDPQALPRQREAFATQIRWALEVDLPIVIHSRDTMDECIEMVTSAQSGSLRGVFHCFTGTAEQARRIVDLGFYLGIGGVYTFKNGGVQQAISDIPLDHVVLETDAPYLAPVPHRGKRNEPSYVRLVAARLAEDRGLTLEEVAVRTSQNAEQLFARATEPSV